MRRLSEIFGDKSPGETKKSKDKYKSGTYKEESYKSEDKDEGSDLARGFKNIEAEKYDEGSFYPQKNFWSTASHT